MTNAIIRYDKLYSRNEAVILFHGSAEEAQSLDGILKGLSGSKVGWKLQGQELIRPTAVEESVDSFATPDRVPMPEHIVKMYTIDSQHVPGNDAAWRAYRDFLFRFRDAAKREIEGLDIYNSLPVLVEADTPEQAIKKWEQQKKDLARFQGKLDLRNAEVAIYLQGFFNLAAKVEPPKYVFEFTKVQYL